MHKEKSGIKWKIVFIAGLALIALALILLIANIIMDRIASKASDSVIKQMGGGTVIYEPLDDETSDDSSGEDVPKVLLDGKKYIGVLYIDSLDLELPVQSSTTDSGLWVSPCRYSGSVETNDFIICAHNMSSQFGRIKNLKPGDEIMFRTLDGSEYIYTVKKLETIDGNDVEGMKSGGYPLTLFTCTMSRSGRVAVRCR